MAADRFNRDPGIRDIIEYFDQPEKCAWHLLTDKEANVLYEELRRCEDPDTGFPYAAKNYFWITTKGGSDTLLRFKDTQEMVWETIRYLRMRNERGVRMMIVKARQLFITSFTMGLLAWMTRFNPNNRGLLLSYNDEHAAKMFGMVLHIFDQLPWWLRPMIGSRQYREGIHLINPDPDLRRLEPGLNSRITVQSAEQKVGVAEGETINTAMLSEWGSYDPAKARKIIMGDFPWALPDERSTTAILETRVQRNSKFAERLWEKMVELGEDADWYPLFIPIYFDRSHFIPPRAGWKPEAPELAIKERAAEEWCMCPQCGQKRPRRFGGAELDGVPCRDCKTVAYQPYQLQDGQMLWLQRTRQNAISEQALVEMQQSLATNPQEAFAHVTETVFSKQAIDWVASTARGDCLARGHMAANGVFHAPRRIHSADPKEWGQESAQCFNPGCKKDHSGEVDRYLRIWQPPQKGAEYYLTADVAAGYGGGNDYSVFHVVRMFPAPNPDIQVATFRCNTIHPNYFADAINFAGRWYNNALVIVDYTNYQTTGDRLRLNLNYPNLYRWFQAEAVKQQSNRWHWTWNVKNKHSAWAELDGWLREHALIIKDPVTAKEMRHFQRFEDGTMGASNAKEDSGLGDDMEKIHDDTVTAFMQGVIAAHQNKPRRVQYTPQVAAAEGPRAPGEWRGTCVKCDRSFEAMAPQDRERCPFCGSIWMKWKVERAESAPPLGFEFGDMSGIAGQARDRNGAASDFSFGYGGMRDGQINF